MISNPMNGLNGPISSPRSLMCIYPNIDNSQQTPDIVWSFENRRYEVTESQRGWNALCNNGLVVYKSIAARRLNVWVRTAHCSRSSGRSFPSQRLKETDEHHPSPAESRNEMGNTPPRRLVVTLNTASPPSRQLLTIVRCCVCGFVHPPIPFLPTFQSVTHAP